MEKMRQWTVLTALGVVGVLAAGWFLLVSPQRSHATQLRAQAASEQQATAGLQAQVAQLKQQQKGELAQQRRLAEIANMIPDNPQLPTLIRELSAAAHSSGVSLDSLAPSQPSPLVAAVTPAAGAAATGTVEQIPVVIAVTGSYFNIESFMRALEHLDRALKSSDITIAPATAGSTDAAAPNALTAQITANVFESPTVAPAAATAQSAAPVAAQPSAAAQSTSGGTTTPATSGTSGQ